MSLELSKDATRQIVGTDGENRGTEELLLADSSVPCPYVNRIMCPGGGTASPGQVGPLENLPTYRGANPSAGRVIKPSQMQFNNAEEIINSGGDVPALRGYKYDLGSQALKGLLKASFYAQSDNMPDDERRALNTKIDEDRDAILKGKHDMKAIENELANSPQMQSIVQRAMITGQLNESLQIARNFGDRNYIAKASRDAAVWDIAYIDAVQNNRIERMNPDQMEALKKQTKNSIALAQVNDAQNPDLAQLKSLAESFGITVDDNR